MKPEIGGATAVAGIVGGPGQVVRSLSPAIHNAAFQALGLDWAYVGFPVAGGKAVEAIRGLAAAGVAGLNVTMPHKLAAAEAVDRLEGAAAPTGAVNTVQLNRTEMIGHNTDGEGLIRFLRDDAGVDLAGLSVLVLGAGGAARSTVHAVALAGAASIEVAAREPAKASRLSALAGEAEFRAIGLAEAGEAIGRASLIVNATPVGSGAGGEPPPVSLSGLRPTSTVIDLVYGGPTTALIDEARARGASAHDGLGMLVYQAALAFEIWTGIHPPIDVMFSSLKRRLEGAD